MKKFKSLVVAIFAICLVVAGCSNLPTSGPVNAADPVDSPDPQVRLVAVGPVDGASPEEIVDGFVSAAAVGYPDDFAVARQFLSEAVAAEWQPRDQTLIFPDTTEPELAETDTGGIDVSVPTVASVDEAGLYDEMIEVDDETTMSFSLARNPDGEWRIVELDDGVLLSEENFRVHFQPTNLFFPSVTRSELVPDLRWIPRSNLATAMVQELLAGPASWLASSITDVIPDATRLIAGSVVVTDGTAEVDLSTEVLQADSADRTVLANQIERTLMANTTNIDAVEITAGGSPFDFDPASSPMEPYPLGNQTLMAISFGSVAVIDDAEITSIPGALGPNLGEPNNPTVSPGEEDPFVAYLDGEEYLLAAMTPGQTGQTLYTGTSLIPPSIDHDNWVWSGERSNNGSLIAVQPDGDAVEVQAEWLADSTVSDVRISREGSRAIVVSTAPSGSIRIDVVAIERTTNGTPRALSETRVPIGTSIVDVSDVVWIDESRVAVLGRSEGATSANVHVLYIGGPASSLPAVPNAESLAGLRGERSLIVGTRGGELHERSGAGWSSLVGGATDPSYPG